MGSQQQQQQPEYNTHSRLGQSLLLPSAGLIIHRAPLGGCAPINIGQIYRLIGGALDPRRRFGLCRLRSLCQWETAMGQTKAAERLGGGERSNELPRCLGSCMSSRLGKPLREDW